MLGPKEAKVSRKSQCQKSLSRGIKVDGTVLFGTVLFDEAKANTISGEPSASAVWVLPSRDLCRKETLLKRDPLRLSNRIRKMADAETRTAHAVGSPGKNGNSTGPRHRDMGPAKHGVVETGKQGASHLQGNKGPAICAFQRNDRTIPAKSHKHQLRKHSHQ